MKEESRLSPSSPIERALGIAPDRRTGTLQDVQHVVILMQENRSFDHYFGTLPGVRGFADPHPAPTLAGDVLTQADGAARVRPYALQAEYASDARVGYITPHTWDDAQRAWNDGRMDQWLSAKSRLGMGAYRGAEIPFQTALANAFTLCDAYHCSIHAGTNPNRLFLWTGTNDPQGQAGGPALVNTYDRLGPAGEGYAWTTYPERLQLAGVDWRIYQDMADNYHDNPLAGFQQYRRQHADAAGDAPLRDRGLSTCTLDELARDVARGTLPQVSWIIAPTADSEHPEVSSPVRGGAYTERVLEILTRNPEVWSRCVFFVTYDENDCFFDHMPPPAPPARAPDGQSGGLSTVELDGEYHDTRHGPSAATPDDPAGLHGRGFGLGPRVPMLVVSPWSRGGWVNSQVFDHTSVIRFLEARFGVLEPNISAWRREIAGDLTSAFDFTATRGAHAKGRRQACALPYALDVQGRLAADGGHYRLTLRNPGAAAAVLHVYDRHALEYAPRRYTVSAGARLDDGWRLHAGGAYDLWLLGPDGLHRRFRGDARDAGTLEAQVAATATGLSLRLVNRAEIPQPVKVESRMGDGWCAMAHVRADGSLELAYGGCQGWYDLEISAPAMPAFGRRLAGRIDAGKAGVPDPRLEAGASLPLE
ncbi:phosphocholine-specific phospholipase C [Achromobacter xylosoxidans]|uniref:Phospholipase C, phosphocholine-specific n=1 Tax=Alcaligenes xylosoxydans xylosoxydans TaxID=85698 RepID=A0A424WGB9_ALCXX|nr:phospholipase C, phosphocholine-specific [Achromobacter xylosoxidans]MBC9905347.1 phospholipase C, phosphocholine-specific [Achromobacter xylosoxidans]MBD0869079.1 phospholipase C, phosphocholine-specific [Achromobacter xylosoxidans]QNP84107.1 phospholipase C, phosphocholine-specific [Achromobacter xylosoxidans]RPJ92277.1 phospholipase C, phosphocholine-specific [Achromobacter xylosoxidans]